MVVVAAVKDVSQMTNKELLRCVAMPSYAHLITLVDAVCDTKFIILK
jgi:hypothetical protein